MPELHQGASHPGDDPLRTAVFGRRDHGIDAKRDVHSLNLMERPFFLKYILPHQTGGG